MKSFKLSISYLNFVIMIMIGYNLHADSSSNFEKDLQLLLNRLDNCDCIYIRNGSEYSAMEAREHMELKMKSSRGRITSIPDFIKYIATKSSMTGIPYLIKFKNGDSVESAIWLTTQWEILQKSRTPQ